MLSVTDNFLQKFPRLLVHVFKRFRSLSILIKSLVSNEIRVLKNTVEECTGVISLKSYAAEWQRVKCTEYVDWFRYNQSHLRETHRNTDRCGEVSIMLSQFREVVASIETNRRTPLWSAEDTLEIVPTRTTFFGIEDPENLNPISVVCGYNESLVSKSIHEISVR